MRRRNCFSALLVLLAFAGTALSADTYKIDTVHSYVGFSVRHMVLANVKGEFTDFSGTIVYDEADITKSSVEVTIKAASINTGNEKRDADLRSENFFEVEKYPLITFKSKRIEKKGDGYVMVGDLTMHGVTREVSFPFKFLGKIKDPWGNTRIGAEASLVIDRRDFGLKYDKRLDAGGLVVGNEVKIELNVEAVKQ
jgi:polyisoprenoid-binding protein YceI